MARFTGKIEVVTGASKGIGAGIARRLATEGASVAVNYASSREDASRVVDEIRRAGGMAVAVGGSVAKEAEVARLLGEVRTAFGRVDVLAPPAAAIYVGSKGAVDSITKSLANQLAPRKIRVNGVNPGFVITEETHASRMAGGAFEEWAVSITPLGRPGQPNDIAAAVAFLASDDASWITGESLLVAGGAGM
jgi:3-oxoacyl-[acyl-carrier protein] reductase